MKIVLLPLDERPCNSLFPKELPLSHDIVLVLPPLELLSKMKKTCDIAKLHEWLINECKDADYALIALDTLLYGGIVPSRLHHETLETLQKRSEVLHVLKQNNPKIKIFVNELIMRTPCYSNSIEEPDYFDVCGRELWEYGYYLDKSLQNLLTNAEQEKMDALYESLPKDHLKDLMDRREINKQATLNNLKYILEGVIDYFIIPQDDCAPFGFTSIDRRAIRKFLVENQLANKVLMYPGADEAGLVLISKTLNDYYKKMPKVYIKYSYEDSKNFIPEFEDRPVDISLSEHLIIAGAERTYDYDSADMVLAVNVPNKEDKLLDFVNFLVISKNDNKVVGLSDVSYCNRGDLALFEKLYEKDMLGTIDAYAGWNTSSNSTGTVIANMMAYFYSKDDEKKNLSLVSRYIEDVFYMGEVRNSVAELVKEAGVEEFTTDNLEWGKKELMTFVTSRFEDLSKKYELNKVYNAHEIKVYFPWNRIFEIGLLVK